MEPLAQPPEHDEGLGGEGARGDFTVGLLEAPGGALALEAAVCRVGAGASVPAHAGEAAP